MSEEIFPSERIINKIYNIRGQKVMLDRDLAELYEVETKYLKRQVRRNIERFPEDFVFQLKEKELENWRSQFGTSNSENMGLRYKPYAFTEQGVAMLAGLLKSERAIQVNIYIIRTFVKMREMLMTHQDLLIKMQALDSKVVNHDKSIKQLFDYLNRFIEEKGEPRKKVGYRIPEK